MEPAGAASTDIAWEEWGRRDPYYGVITHPRFRRAAMTDAAKEEFFATGEPHVNHVLRTIRAHIDADFAPRQVLDFGCGVGRLVIPFARVADKVVGIDVSPSMLREAQANCAERQLRNVQLIQSDDQLTAIKETFDLIHSCIVFQHIPTDRGRVILSNLLKRLRPGGVAAIHVTYSKAHYHTTHGVPPLPPSLPHRSSGPSVEADPEMQMNSYNMTEILFLAQSHGARRCYLEFTDHGGELGVFLFLGLPLTET